MSLQAQRYQTKLKPRQEKQLRRQQATAPKPVEYPQPEPPRLKPLG